MQTVACETLHEQMILIQQLRTPDLNGRASAYLHAMTSLRMQALVAHLRVIEQELLTIDPHDKPDEKVLASMKELKAAVDGIRATLWCYLADQAAEVLPAPEAIKMARMNRVVELFREARNGQTKLN